MLGRVAWVLLLSVAAGCGTPSRRLPTRIVDDPMVLPRRMMMVSVDSAVGQLPRPQFHWEVLPNLSYGLTDRLELQEFLSLQWAILDDAPEPAEGRQRDRLSLAVRAGATGVGFSSISGFTVYPVASVSVLKHLGERTWVGAQGQWNASWIERPYSWSDWYSDTLWPNVGNRWSRLALDATVLRQLSNRVALRAGLGVHELRGCSFISCSWAARGGGLWLGPSVRPWHWLTLSLQGYAGGRYRPAQQVAGPPDAPLASLPRTVSWLGISGFVAFHW
jgi:hypothetical protein